MNGVDFWQIIKWVLIVLVAGFIGQFGKTLSKHIMERLRAGKEEAPSGTEERTKQGKKALKALAKQKKKEAKLTEKQKE